MARHGLAGQGLARQALQCVAAPGSAGHGGDWLGEAGSAWRGPVRSGSAWLGFAERSRHGYVLLTQMEY